MADGTIRFDTAIDTKGISNSRSKLEKSFKGIADAIKRAFGKADNNYALKNMQRQAEDAERAAQKAADDYARQAEQAAKLAEELEDVKKQQEEIAKEREAINNRKFTPKTNLPGFAEKERANFDASKSAALAQNAKQSAALKARAATLQSQVDKFSIALPAAQDKMTRLTEKAAMLRDRVKEAMTTRRPSLFGKALGSLKTTFSAVGKKITGFLKNMLIFSVITKALTKIKELFTTLAGSDKQVGASLARIKGNLLTAFQPIYEAVIPALRKLLAILEVVTAKIAQIMATVFGKSTSQMSKNAKALNKNTSAIKKEGKAAEEASKSLARFDELNQLGSDDKSGGGADEGGVAGVDFSGTSDLGELDAKTAKIVSYGSLILGTCLLVAGIFLVNIPMILAGIALVATGLAVGENSGAFESTPDWVKQVITWGTMIIGVVMLIVGIATVNIPLMIAGAALIGVSIAYGMKTGVFTAAWEAIKNFFKNIGDHVKTWWQGVKTWFATYIKPFFTAQWWSTFFSNMGAAISNKWNQIKTTVVNAFNTLKSNVVNAWTTIQNKVTTVWTNIKNSIKNSVNSVIGYVEGFVNKIIYGVNFLIAKLNNLTAAMPDWLKQHTPIGNFRVQQLSYVKLPRLASGTVVPANYGEFAAVLGDNKRETEVVSPLSTIKEAMKQALAESGALGNGGISNITLTIANRTISEGVIEYVNGRTKQLGVSVIKGV